MERAAVDAHLATCSACQQAAERLAADHAAFLAGAAIPTLAAAALEAAQVRPAEPMTWLRRLVPLGAGLGLAAAAVLLAPRPTDTRTKGGFSLGAFVQRGLQGGLQHGGQQGVQPDVSRPGERHAGEPLHPGDRLRLVVSTPAPGYLAVIGVDEARQVSVYYPQGERTAALPAVRDHALDSAIELDGTLGHETIIAVHCASALPVADVTRAARRALDALPQGVAATERGKALERVPVLDLPCVEARYELTKTPAPAGAPTPAR